MAKILIIHTGDHLVFAERDREILSRKYPTETLGFTSIRQLPRLWQKMNNSDIVIFWFVGRAAIWAMMAPPRGKKIVAVVGGYEAANEPDIGYGSARSPIRRALVQRILNRSSKIVAVSDYMLKSIQNNYHVGPGVITLIHNAIDTEFFVPAPAARREGFVMTVANPGAWQNRIKRLDIVQAVAEIMPEVQFRIIGRVSDNVGRRFMSEAPQNLEFVGELSQNELRDQYRKAAVYFQPSRHESFGVAVIEAMSCGCIPVVSPHGALPEVVGDAGFILDHLDPHRAADVLRQALRAPVEAREHARARVVQFFDTRMRAQKLYELIADVMASS